MPPGVCEAPLIFLGGMAGGDTSRGSVKSFLARRYKSEALELFIQCTKSDLALNNYIVRAKSCCCNVLYSHLARVWMSSKKLISNLYQPRSVNKGAGSTASPKPAAKTKAQPQKPQAKRARAPSNKPPVKPKKRAKAS